MYTLVDLITDLNIALGKNNLLCFMIIFLQNNL